MRHDKHSSSSPAVPGHLHAVGHAKPAAAPRIARVRLAPADLFELFGALIEAMPDAIVVATQAGTIALVNAETERLFGYGRSELIGQPVEILVPERFWGAHRGHSAGYFRAASLRPMGSGVDLSAVRRDGHEFPVAISLSPFQTKGGALVISAIRDVTVQRAAQRVAERARVADVREEFLATVSHELRTPLNAILGWQRMMEPKQLPPERAAHAVAAIGRSAAALAHMVDDLLDASRIVRGTIRLALQPVDLAAVTQAALETLRPLAANRNVQLAFEGAPDDRTINGDAGRLQQVIWNLVSNAIKFTPPGGRVDVVIEGSTSHMEVRVVDTGQGISVEFLPHVFERFRQGDEATTQRHTGLGLGLGIVLQLVELHGGTVHAASPGVGHGATFTVRLPVSAGDAQSGHPVAFAERRRR